MIISTWVLKLFSNTISMGSIQIKVRKIKIIIDKMDLFSFFMSDSPSYDSLRLILAYISDATSPSTDIITAIAADFPNWNRLNA